MEKVKAVLLGAGQRGAGAYAPYALKFPNEFEITAVAEYDEKRLREFQEQHHLKDECCFKNWEDLLALGKIADAVLVCTQDRMHYKPTMKALELGYDVLLEKPMSNDPKECVLMSEYANAHDRILTVCHVLRYTPFYSTIKEIIDSGKIGDVISLNQEENVSYWHQAHSFVRGNWRNSHESSPMILQKSCHDMDIIHWLMGSDCKKLSSFGSLSHFNEAHAPIGAPKYCLDGCAYSETCPYYAPGIYITCEETWQAEVIRKVISVDTSVEGLTQALKTGPYGRCVYHCDNDVVDHQVVDMEFENGATASFTMCAFTLEEGRKIKVMGTKGQINGSFDDSYIELMTFLDRKKEVIELKCSSESHGGGDIALIHEFVEQVRTKGEFKGRSLAGESLHGHLMSGAAEKSRLCGEVVEIEKYKEELM